MSDYRLKAKFQNNRILEAMEAFGIKNVAELSRQCGIDQNKLGDFVNMKKSPINNLTKEITPTAQRLLDFFGASLGELFNLQQIYDPVKINKAEIKLSNEAVMAIMDNSGGLDQLIANESKTEIAHRLLEDLRPREQKILIAYYGLDNEEGNTPTLDELAKEYDCTRERIRQILEEGERKIKIKTAKDRKLRNEALDAYYS